MASKKPPKKKAPAKKAAKKAPKKKAAKKPPPKKKLSGPAAIVAGIDATIKEMDAFQEQIQSKDRRRWYAQVRATMLLHRARAARYVR